MPPASTDSGSPPRRAADLLAQMTGLWNDEDATLIGPVTGNSDLEKTTAAFGIGQVGRPSDVTAVRGLQGDGRFRDRQPTIATLKSFAAHGQPEPGMNAGPAHVSEGEPGGVFLPPFLEALRNGGVLRAMAPYHEIDGLSSHTSPWLHDGGDVTGGGVSDDAPLTP